MNALLAEQQNGSGDGDLAPDALWQASFTGGVRAMIV
jgi:hypothetical protein